MFRSYSRTLIIVTLIALGLMYVARWQIMFRISEDLTLKMACRSFMRDSLFDPSSGQFVDLSDFQYKKVDGKYYVSGAVRARNGFNALVLNEFWCEMSRVRGGAIILDNADIGIAPLVKLK